MHFACGSFVSKVRLLLTSICVPENKATANAKHDRCTSRQINNGQSNPHVALCFAGATKGDYQTDGQTDAGQSDPCIFPYVEAIYINNNNKPSLNPTNAHQ